MKHARIQHLLSSYGADPTRWPEPERITARQLSAQLAHDPELATAFADATAVDAALKAIDRTHGAVDDLRTQRLLQSVTTRIQRLPQVTYDAAGKRRSYALAWVAMLPLLLGFVAGATSEAGDTQDLLQRRWVQTESDPSSSVDVSYADETMMAPFVAAAEFSTTPGGHNR